MLLAQVGRVLGTHGVRGHLKCAYTTDNRTLISSRARYLLTDERSGEFRIVELAEIQLKEPYFLIRLHGYDSPEPLKRYANWQLLYPAHRGELPREEGEVYMFELPGLEVRRPDGSLLGEVKEVIDVGKHILLELALTAGGTVMIPFVEQHVPEVKLEEGYLVTTYPLEHRE
jgi:16S rRNA processing protein RimM